MSDAILTSHSHGVLLITLNRPEVRNAVNGAMAIELAAAIDEFESRDDIMVGVITGAGGNFSSGMDLKTFATGDSPVIAGRGLGGLTEAPPTKPLIAAVEGWALAGGCELALAADFIVAADSARFGLPEVKRGLIAAGGGLLRLPKSMPYPVAMMTALTGDPITANEALRYGLVAKLAADGGAVDAAMEVAATIASNSPSAVKATKRIISEVARWTDPEGLALQREVANEIRGSADAAEGARAFVEKRAPVWRRS